MSVCVQHALLKTVDQNLILHETEFFHWSEVDIVVKLLVITLTYHNLIYYLYFSDILCAIDVLCSTRSDYIDIL